MPIINEWSRKESKALLDIMEKIFFQSNDIKLYRHPSKYKIIEKEMVSRGFMKRTAQQIKRRWTIMIRQYDKIKKNKQTRYFRYFKELDRILGGGIHELVKPKKKISWTQNETEALLNIVEKSKILQCKNYKLYTFEAKYEKIEKEMLSRGFMKNAKQICGRLKTLKSQYVLAKETNQTKSFQYFNEMDRILVGRRAAKQKKNFWSHNETEALLNIAKNFNCFQSKDYTLNSFASIYEKIEKEMLSIGFMKNAKQIYDRLRTLKSQYVLAKETNGTKSFQYFNKLDRLLGEVVQGKQKKTTSWTQNETESLLNIMQEYNCFEKNDGTMIVPRGKYKIIEKEMESRGFSRKPKQIYQRLNILKSQYVLAKTTNQTKYFQYFNELNRMLGDRASVAAVNKREDRSRNDIVLAVEMNVDTPVVTRVQEVVQTKEKTKFPKNLNYEEIYMKRMEKVADDMTYTQKSYTKKLFKNQKKRIDNEFNIYEKNEEEFIECSINKTKEILTNNTKVFLNNLSQILKSSEFYSCQRNK